jgi:hypothetical protein
MAGTDPYGLFYSGSGITVLGPEQIRPPVGAGELVNPPGYGLRPALLPPDMPGHNEVLAWVEALSAIARTNAERGVDHGGGFAGLLELSMAFYLGAREGEADGALLILDNLTIGLVPGLNNAAEQVRTANAGSMAYTVADWSAAVGTTTLPGVGAFKALGIGAKAAKGTKAAGAAAGAAGAARAGLVASDGVVIRGFTGHGIDRVVGDGAKRAGVNPRAIMDALKNPKAIKSGVDSKGRPYRVYQGRDARVVANPETGQVVSVNPSSSAGTHGP